jgi:hypothetical protein
MYVGVDAFLTSMTGRAAAPLGAGVDGRLAPDGATVRIGVVATPGAAAPGTGADADEVGGIASAARIDANIGGDAPGDAAAGAGGRAAGRDGVSGGLTGDGAAVDG